MTLIVHYFLSFGDWIGASTWRSYVFIAAVAIAIVFAG